ncbi:MAG: hypothetical protein HOW71_17740, partial [Nonomuraea sp.]|nr:hypothetical protein [Nonomuraea sp.]
PGADWPQAMPSAGQVGQPGQAGPSGQDWPQAPPAGQDWPRPTYQMGPAHPSYPSNPEAGGNWPQWPSDGWPSDPRSGSGGFDTHDVWEPPRWNGERGLPKRPLGEPPPWKQQDGSGRPDFPETESATTGPIPPVPPASAGDDYLPIFAAVESAWFGRNGGASWGSEKSDAGWSAAEAAAEPVRDGSTAAGLPKRVPKANLVPGSADTSSSPKGVTPMPSVSPDRVRNRLSSFQQGFRAARDDITEGRAFQPGPRGGGPYNGEPRNSDREEGA